MVSCVPIPDIPRELQATSDLWTHLFLMTVLYQVVAPLVYTGINQIDAPTKGNYLTYAPVI